MVNGKKCLQSPRCPMAYMPVSLPWLLPSSRVYHLETDALDGFLDGCAVGCSAYGGPLVGEADVYVLHALYAAYGLLDIGCAVAAMHPFDAEAGC